jgi:hypothetical protein
MANWDGQLYQAFWSSKHVVQIESCGEFDNNGGCDKNFLLDNNIPSRIFHGGWSA